jgi:membrane protease YdiL (CAAX protease family)
VPSWSAPDQPVDGDGGSLAEQLAQGAAPATPGSAGWWLFCAGLGFVIGQVVAAIFAALAAAATGSLHDLSRVASLNEPPTWYIVSTLLGLWAGFAGGPWLASVVRGTGRLARDVGLRFRAVDLAGIAIGVGGQLLVVLIYLPISHLVPHFNQRFDAPSQRLTGGSHGLGFAVIALATVVGAPFFEELFFRGLLLRALVRLCGGLGRRLGPVLAVVVTGVLFGLAHAESLQLLGLATFGIILSVVSYRTGRLGMNMIAHASFNLVAVVAILHTGTGLVL